ncbi:hypothetical protein [Microbacterium gorillae]|uniref:hypothetical protein n=1 Tax=Microbacterium gorillae TaxID=1231063 RepID=UPI00058F41BF|nr:hypothetical protein [Microbacterium gorillae]
MTAIVSTRPLRVPGATHAERGVLAFTAWLERRVVERATHRDRRAAALDAHRATADAWWVLNGVRR